MSGKLDQSLDDIVSSHRRGPGRGPRGRRSGPTRSAATKSTAAPVGGIKKNTTKAAKPVIKGAPTGPSGVSGNSRIIISGLVSTQVNQLLHHANFRSPRMSMAHSLRYVVDQATMLWLLEPSSNSKIYHPSVAARENPTYHLPESMQLFTSKTVSSPQCSKHTMGVD